MADVRLRSGAAADLAEILTFSKERFGTKTARAYAAGLRNALSLIAQYPHIGRLQEGVTPVIRCYTFRRHRIFYDIEGENVWIVRIFHHAMDADRRLK